METLSLFGEFAESEANTLLMLMITGVNPPHKLEEIINLNHEIKRQRERVGNHGRGTSSECKSASSRR